MSYLDKYLKYKTKYIQLKELIGGDDPITKESPAYINFNKLISIIDKNENVNVELLTSISELTRLYNFHLGRKNIIITALYTTDIKNKIVAYLEYHSKLLSEEITKRTEDRTKIVEQNKKVLSNPKAACLIENSVYKNKGNVEVCRKYDGFTQEINGITLKINNINHITQKLPQLQKS